MACGDVGDNGTRLGIFLSISVLRKTNQPSNVLLVLLSVVHFDFARTGDGGGGGVRIINACTNSHFSAGHPAGHVFIRRLNSLSSLHNLC